MGITLPEVAAPVGSYVPALQTGNLVLTSGQLPLVQGKLQSVGKVPTEVTLEEAQQAARTAVINALAAVASVTGDLERVDQVVRLGVFVNSCPDFTDQPKVANSASDLLKELFGEKGRHVRAAVGNNELPLNAPVELELTVQIRT